MEKKSNTGVVVAGSLAALGFIGALVGAVSSSGKKTPKQPGFGRPPVRRPVRVRSKGCGR